jgi:hypothetical protein
MSEIGIDPFDPVGQLLRDRVASVAAHVSVPDWRRVIEHQARRRVRRRVRRASLAVTVLSSAATIVVALLSLTSAAPQVTALHVKYGGYRLMVRDLPAAARAAPRIPSSQVTLRSLPVRTPNHAAVAFGAASTWVLAAATARQASASYCGRLVRVSWASAAVTASRPTRLCPNAVTYGSNSVWVLSSQIGLGYRLAQVNPSTLATVSVTTISGGRHGIVPTGDTGSKYTFAAASSRSVYVSVPSLDGGAQITVLDTATRRRTAVYNVPGRVGPVTALSASGSYVWAGTANGWVLGLDPATAAIRAARHVGTRVVSLAVAPAALWVSVNLPVPARARSPGLDVLRLNPDTGALSRDTGLPMTYVTTDGYSVWALGSAPPYESENGLVAQLDPASGMILRSTVLPAPGYRVPDTIGVMAGHAWVLNDFLGQLASIGP